MSNSVKKSFRVTRTVDPRESDASTAVPIAPPIPSAVPASETPAVVPTVLVYTVPVDATPGMPAAQMPFTWLMTAEEADAIGIAVHKVIEVEFKVAAK